jgi:Interferon-induced 6-16 family
MLLSGVMAVAFVQLFVWFIGFGKRGIRKGTMAAALIKYRNGFVPANSWLSTLQSVGAGGLGRKRMAMVCLYGAVTSLVWLCIRAQIQQHRIAGSV